jgi:hypothetical protein
MTRFAGIALPAAMLVALESAMGGLEKRAEHLFVAGLARFRTSVLGALGRGRRDRRRGYEEKGKDRPDACPFSWNSHGR